MSVVRALLKLLAKTIIAALTIVIGGFVVGAILLRSLLFQPEAPGPLAPAETSELPK